MKHFQKLIFTPVGDENISLAVAACRARETGVLNFELGGATVLWAAALERLAATTHSSTSRAADAPVGIQLESADLLATLDRAAAGKAAGLDGGRYEHYLAALSRDPKAATESSIRARRPPR